MTPIEPNILGQDESIEHIDLEKHTTQKAYKNIELDNESIHAGPHKHPQEIKNKTEDKSDEENLTKKETTSSKSDKIKGAFYDWSQETSFQAFPKIFKENTHVVVRIFWSIIFLAFTGITVYLLAQGILEYCEWSTASTVQIVRESPTQFPAITICDSNPFTSINAQNLLEKLAMEKFNITISTMSDTQFNVYKTDLNDYAKMVVNNPDFGDENRKLLGFPSLAPIGIQFKFATVPQSFSTMLQWYWHSNYGNCYQFNLNTSSLLQQSAEGDYYGLIMSFGPVIRQNVYPMSDTNGLKIFIQNQTFPSPGVFDTFISLDSGKETSLSIEKKFSSSTPAPYSSCIDLTNGFNSDLYNFISNKNGDGYRQKDCLVAGYQQEIQKTCNCFWTLIPKYYDTPPCLNSTQLDCFNSVASDYSVNQSDFIQRYMDRCPLECDTVKYEFELSSLNYPSTEEYNKFKSDPVFADFQALYNNIDVSTYELYKDYYYSMKIFFPTTSYEQITDSPQLDIYGLLANLGGTLGMFLAFTVFSFVELIEIIIKTLWLFFSVKEVKSSSFA